MPKWIMLPTIFWGKRHFFMSGHLCLTIYKMGDLWNVTSCINEIRTWHSTLRSRLPISKFWWHINFVKIDKKMTFKKLSCFVQLWDLAQIKTVQLSSTPQLAVTWTSLWIFLLALAIDRSEKLFGTTFEC